MIKLKSAKIYWCLDSKIKPLIDAPIKLEDMPLKDIKHLVKELDRRLIQLWDKVNYERTKEP